MRNTRGDIKLWVHGLWGVNPTKDQCRLLDAMVPPRARVSAKSGHGTGKTTCAAWLITWFLAQHFRCKGVATAPSAPQLHDVLWAELATWVASMPSDFRDIYRMTSDHIRIVGAERERFMAARTSRRDTPEALSGIHSENTLIIGEEASGIPDTIFEHGRGSMTSGNARTLLISNPSRVSGYFFETHTRLREYWTTLTMSSLDSPLVDPSFAREIAEEFGEDSAFYLVRVKGEFPQGDEDALISLDWIDSALEREVDYTGAPLLAGLDVARYGADSNALVIRQGGRILYLDEWRGLDTMQTAGRVAAKLREIPVAGIYIDVIGLGAGVVDRLNEQGFPVHAVNVSESPAGEPGRFRNLRDELWWRTREFFRSLTVRVDFALPVKLRERMAAELSAPRYSFDSSGRIVVESKDELKKRGVRSPNIADALVHTMAHGLIAPAASCVAAAPARQPIVRRRLAV